MPNTNLKIHTVFWLAGIEVLTGTDVASEDIFYGIAQQQMYNFLTIWGNENRNITSYQGIKRYE